MTTSNNKEPLICFFAGAVFYSLKYVFIHIDGARFTLVVIAGDGLKVKKSFKSLSGAKIHFRKKFCTTCILTQDEMQEVSRLSWRTYGVDPKWLKQRLNTPRHTGRRNAGKRMKRGCDDESIYSRKVRALASPCLATP